MFEDRFKVCQAKSSAFLSLGYFIISQNAYLWMPILIISNFLGQYIHTMQYSKKYTRDELMFKEPYWVRFLAFLHIRTQWGQILFEVGCEIIKLTFFDFTRYFPSLQVLKLAFCQKLRCNTNICAKSQSRAEILKLCCVL